MKSLTDAYGRRRLREMRDLGNLVYLAVHQPEEMNDALRDPDPEVLADLANMDAERWWSYGGQG